MKHVEVNADGLTVETHIEEGADGSIAIAEAFSMDAQSVVDAVHAEHMDTGGKSKSGALWHVGEVPIPLLMDLARKLGLSNYMQLTKPEFAPYLIAFLRDNPRLSPTSGKI